MEFKSIKTAFFVIPIWKWIASEFIVDAVGFNKFALEEINFRGTSLCTKLNFVAFPWMETSFLDFQEWN